MNGTDQAVAAGIVGASLFMLMAISLVLLILLIIARWKVFTKAGEKGWKSLIPVYADYVQWRIGWRKTGLFWLAVLMVIAACIVGYATGVFTVDAYGNMNPTGSFGVGGVVYSVLLLAAAILQLIAVYKLFASFGHGVGWLIGYIFVPGIMLLVLGFGSSRYFGPQD